MPVFRKSSHLKQIFPQPIEPFSKQLFRLGDRLHECLFSPTREKSTFPSHPASSRIIDMMYTYYRYTHTYCIYLLVKILLCIYLPRILLGHPNFQLPTLQREAMSLRSRRSRPHGKQIAGLAVLLAIGGLLIFHRSRPHFYQIAGLAGVAIGGLLVSKIGVEWCSTKDIQQDILH